MFEKIIHLINKNIYVLKKKYNEFIEKLKFGKLYTEDQVHLFNFLNVGDVVFSHMPLKHGEMYDIPEGHRVRPYIIVKKTENFIYGYPSSSSKRKSLSSARCFEVLSTDAKEGFEISYKAIVNDSYFDLSQVYKLEKHHLIEFFFRITNAQKKELYRKLLCLKDNGDDVILFEYDYEIEIGDIVEYRNKYYYVFSKTIDRYVLYPIKKDTQLIRPVKLKIKNETYEIDPYAVLNLNIKAELKREYSIYSETSKDTNNSILKTRKYAQKKYIYAKNDVIKTNYSNKKYIVKEDLGKIILAFELSYKKDSSKIRCKYKNKKVYYDKSEIEEIQENTIQSYEGIIED